jgi:hypothetical protein
MSAKGFRNAVVAVIQSSSHRGHYGYASRTPFLEASTLAPWVSFEFYEEDSLPDLANRLRRNAVDGLLLSSGCLQSMGIRNELTSGVLCEALLEAHQRGVGVLVLHQAMPPGTEFQANFVPEALQFSIARAEPVTLDVPLATDGFRLSVAGGAEDERRTLDALRTDSAGNISQCWTHYRVKHSYQWLTRVWEPGGHGAESLSLIQSSAGLGPRVLLSSLALDWDSQAEVMAALAARACRARTMAFYRTGEAHDYRALPYLTANAHLDWAVRELDPTAERPDAGVDGFYFGHLVFSPHWRFSNMPFVSEQNLRSRLENGGTIAAFVDSPTDHQGDRPTLIQVAGPTQYATQVEWYASWLMPRRRLAETGFTFDLRGLAFAASVIESTYADAGTIPPGLRSSEVQPIVRRAVRRRLNGAKHVDNLIIPTAACAHALTLVGLGEEAQPLINWLNEALADRMRPTMWLQDAVAAEEAQVRLWLPQLQEPRALSAWLDVHKHNASVPGYLRESMQLLNGHLRSQELDDLLIARLVSTAGRDETPLTVSADIVTLLCRAGGHTFTSDLVELVPHLSRRLKTAEHQGGTMEVISVLVGALLLIENRMAPPVARFDDIFTRPVNVQPVAQLEMERELLDLELAVAAASERADDARDHAHHNRMLARIWLIVAVVVLLLSDTGITALLLANGFTDPSTTITVAIAGASAIVVSMKLAQWFGRLPWSRGEP